MLTLVFLLITAILLAPAIIIAGFWWTSLRHHAQRPGDLPDTEALILARVGGIACGLLPVFQLVASIVRWHTGEAGLYLWYLVPVMGVLLAVTALAAFLSYARGTERGVSSGMVLLSISMLLLITLLAGADA